MSIVNENTAVHTAHEAMVALGIDPASQPWHSQGALGQEIIGMAMRHDPTSPATTVAEALMTRLMRRSERVQKLLAEIQQLKTDFGVAQSEERRQRELAAHYCANLECRNATIKNYEYHINWLVEEIERLEPLQKTVREQSAELERLRPLAAKEQARKDAISARRSRAAKAAAKKRAAANAAARKERQQRRYEALLGEAISSGEIPDLVHKALAKRLGVTRAFAPVWAEKATAKPAVIYEPAYHTTMSGGTVVHSPNSYGYPTQYHCAVRQIHLGKGWYKRNLKSLCREAAAL